MSRLALSGRVVVDREVWDQGTVLIEGERILAVERGLVRGDTTVEEPDGYLVPGFVDLQVNGAFGVDVATQPDKLAELSRVLLATGTTAYLPTLISLPRGRYRDVLAQFDIDGEPVAGPLGLHLEGPFLNPNRRGAHPRRDISNPDPAFLAALLEHTRVRMVTLAPEMPGAGTLKALAKRSGAVVSVGHSQATFEEARNAFRHGVSSVTHLFNAMNPFHHREPGILGAALVQRHVACGLIVDGHHVHPTAIDMAYRVFGPDRIYLVTDATAACGMEEGVYSLAGQKVISRDGTPVLENGTLAGSALRMDEALRNVLAFTDCTLPEAVAMASATPARISGEGGRKGKLAPGYDADVVALSADLEVQAVWAAGERRYG